LGNKNSQFFFGFIFASQDFKTFRVD